MTLSNYASRFALVTGASAGIGTAFAREFAARGCNLVLTARREDRLRALADELRAAHGVRVECITADLAQASAVEDLCAEIARRGIAIDILVNNAGYGVPGSFLAPSWPTHADFIRVLMTVPCELVYKLLPGMQQRGYGRILNIASLAGHVPGSAGHTLYGASKAFLIKFSQSLALENTATGVNVCAVCPGFTYSEFHDVSGTRGIVSKMPKWMWMDAADVARIGVDASERGEIVCVTGRVNRAIKSLFKLLPDRFALRSMQKRSKAFRAQNDG
ncbi:MAG: SDR family oxidoreductase [Proteobacteria bacterium]|nr:SDR family oxidoreductase [Pseudomonadota bacterium]